MAEKALVHERVYPVVNKFEPFGAMTNESGAHERHFFVNRKADRFTISARYCESGVSESGKKWLRWRTLFAISATLRQPKSSRFPNLNIFYSGIYFGKRQLGVLNITRNPFIALKSLPVSINELFQDELVDLYERQNQAKAICEKISYGAPIIPESLTELIKDLSYPLFKEYSESKIGTSFPVNSFSIPSFLTTLFRAPTKEDFCVNLKIDPFSELGMYVLENFNNLSVKTIFILLASTGVLNNDDRLEIVHSSESEEKDFSIAHTINQNFLPSSSQLNIMSWDRVDESVATLRDILRKLNPEVSKAILKSTLDSGAFNSFLMATDAWRINHKLTLKIKFEAEDIKNINSYRALDEKIVDRLGELKQEVKDSTTDEEVASRIEALCDNVYLVSNKQSINVKIGDERHALGSSSLQSGIFSLNMGGKALNKKSPIWKIIKNDGITSASVSVTKGKFTKAGAWDGRIKLTATAFVNLLTGLEELAISDLTKYKMETNQSNIALYIAALFVVNSQHKYGKYNGTVPRKFFTLIKNGITPKMAFLFTLKNVSVANSKAFEGLPEAWVYKSLGLQNPDHYASTLNRF